MHWGTGSRNASDDGTGSSQFIFTDAGNDCDDDGITVRREVDNGSCTIVGKTNFYFEYFINGCHTFDAVSKIYEVRIVYLRTADCHGVYTAACGQFFTEAFHRIKFMSLS